MKYTLEELKKIMDANGGSLYLEGCTGITSLPDGLTVGGTLDLEGCTGITSLPDGLTVGGYLDLRGTGITSLPDGLTVGGSLDLRGTGITDASKVNSEFPSVIYKPNHFIYCDGILTHVKRDKKIGKYTFYVGKIKGKNVIFDGENYAHCKDLKTGIIDLEFKAAKNRGAEQYKILTLDSIVKYEDAVIMYRVITGACQQGTQSFIDSLDEIKDEYTVREIIDLTKGRYGATTFAEFFKKYR